MDVPRELLEAFPPNAGAALDLARRYLDDDMLRQIAGADYGLSEDLRFAELLPIRETGVVPPLAFWTHEVLSLSLWIDVRDNDEDPGRGRRHHLVRTFACATLLVAGALPGSSGNETEDSELALLLTSAAVLGEEWSVATAQFLTWRLAESPVPADELPGSLALLGIAVRLRVGRFPDSVLGRIAEWVLAAEAGRGGLLPVPRLEPPPQLFSAMNGLWGSIVLEWQGAAETIQDSEVRTAILLCSQLISPDWR